MAFKPNNNVPGYTSPHPKTTKCPWALFTAFACFPFKSVLHGHGSRGQQPNTLGALFPCKCQTWSSKTEMIMSSMIKRLIHNEVTMCNFSRDLEILGSPRPPNESLRNHLASDVYVENTFPLYSLFEWGRNSNSATFCLMKKGTMWRFGTNTHHKPLQTPDVPASLFSPSVATALSSWVWRDLRSFGRLTEAPNVGQRMDAEPIHGIWFRTCKAIQWPNDL